MSDDLVKRLRDAHANSSQRISGSNIFAEAASAIEAKDAENERLRGLVEDIHELKSMYRNDCHLAETRAEQAERKLQLAQAGLGVADTNHRQMSKQLADLGRALAEAVEVIERMSSFQISETLEKSGKLSDLCKAWVEHKKAARQFVKEHGSATIPDNAGGK